MISRICAGGQAGADRGAFDAAEALGIQRDGWAPKGWRAEDGVIPEQYRVHMRESPSSNYGDRTKRNVMLGDATLVMSFASEKELGGGSGWTLKLARQLGKACMHIRVPISLIGHWPDGMLQQLLRDLPNMPQLRTWLHSHRTVNVAGPRESKEPGIQRAVCAVLRAALEEK